MEVVKNTHRDHGRELGPMGMMGQGFKDVRALGESEQVLQEHLRGFPWCCWCGGTEVGQTTIRFCFLAKPDSNNFKGLDVCDAVQTQTSLFTLLLEAFGHTVCYRFVLYVNKSEGLTLLPLTTVFINTVYGGFVFTPHVIHWKICMSPCRDANLPKPWPNEKKSDTNID